MGKQRDRLRGRLRRAEKGQSLVEMALGLVILLSIIMIILDMGRLYFVYIALEDGAGEAALFLSLNPRCTEPKNPDNPAVAECLDPNNALWRAKNASGGHVSWESATVTASSTGEEVGDVATVRIQYPFNFVTPWLSAISALTPLTLTVEAKQIVVTEAL